MLSITIPYTELWDEGKQKFRYVEEQTLELEHSLVSLSKWESKWHKSFFAKQEKTYEETIDYIKCMTLTPNVKSDVYLCLTNKHMEEIHNYLEDPMTATTFSDNRNSKASKEIITSELIYYWMIALQIPPEYQHWHINRLITLIRVCEIKNAPPGKKKSMRDIMAQNAALNKARRAQMNSKG